MILYCMAVSMSFVFKRAPVNRSGNLGILRGAMGHCMYAI